MKYAIGIPLFLLVAFFIGYHVIGRLMIEGHPTAAAVTTAVTVTACFMWARKW